ncbi:MAG: 6-carboxytetrahydropterin synthase, partial [Chloroflexi bacterium]|nr:6-carboxytetrahydropterin synthase [Chloroflexota bacterium]
ETHYHSWRVEVLIESDANDEEGTILGFAEARGALEAKVADYNETLLNNIEPYDRIQPTAENIARVIFQDIGPGLTRGATRLKTVRVWESPTNHAAYSVA